jgi:hypothetical protein
LQHDFFHKGLQALFVLRCSEFTCAAELWRENLSMYLLFTVDLRGQLLCSFSALPFLCEEMLTF